MKRLVLHIGSNKTGSTSIQQFLHRNHDVLHAAGIYFPSEATSPLHAHHYLASSVRSHPFKVYDDGKTPQELTESILIGSQGCDRIIISSELFFDEKSIAEDKLRVLTSEFEHVEVIVYLRRQDLYAESFYNSRIRTGAKLSSLTEFVENGQFDYSQKLEFWERVADKVTVGIFEKNQMTGGDLLMDFVTKAGISLPDVLDFDIPRTNEAVNSVAAEVLGNINAIADIGQPKRNAIGNYFNELYPTQKGHRFCADQRREIINRFESSNRELGQRYFGILRSPFTVAIPDDGAEHEAVKTQDLYELIAYLCAKAA